MINTFLLHFIVLIFVTNKQAIPFSINNKEGNNNIRSIEPIVSKNNYSSCIDLYLSKNTSHSLIPENIYLKVQTSDLNTDKVYLGIKRHSKFKKWSETIIEDSLTLSSIKLSNVSYYLFTSRIKNATGIRVNYYSMFLFESTSKSIFTNYSLTNTKGIFYCDLKSKKAKLLIFTFDDSYIHNKDYNNIKLNYRIITLKEGTIHKSKLLPLKCSNN